MCCSVLRQPQCPSCTGAKSKPISARLVMGSSSSTTVETTYDSSSSCLSLASFSTVTAYSLPPSSPLPDSIPSAEQLSDFENSPMISLDSCTLSSSSPLEITSSATATSYEHQLPFSPTHMISDSPLYPNSDASDSSGYNSPSSTGTPTMLSPSTTPRKKTVMWTDDLGRPLTAEKIFRKNDETWRCSKRAMPFFAPIASLHPNTGSRSPFSSSASSHDFPHPTSPAFSASSSSSSCSPAPLIVSFQSSRATLRDPLPESSDDIISKLGAQGVQLESAFGHGLQFFLTARVLNVSFEKKVFARVSFDAWASFRDIELAHVPVVSDGRTDSFQGCFAVTGDAELALCFRSSCGEFWDNNHGSNYHVRVSPPSPVHIPRGA